MAELVQKQQKHYDVLAEGLTADGRVAKRVEARADDLADVAEAFRLAAAEARTAHIAVARVRLTAGQAGVTKLAVTLEDSPADPLAQSAMLDGKTKLDVPPTVQDYPPPPPLTSLFKPRPIGTFARNSREEELLKELARQAPDWKPWTIGQSASKTTWTVTGTPPGRGQARIDYCFTEWTLQNFEPEELAQRILPEMQQHLRNVTRP